MLRGEVKDDLISFDGSCHFIATNNVKRNL